MYVYQSYLYHRRDLKILKHAQIAAILKERLKPNFSSNFRWPMDRSKNRGPHIASFVKVVFCILKYYLCVLWRSIEPWLPCKRAQVLLLVNRTRFFTGIVVTLCRHVCRARPELSDDYLFVLRTSRKRDISMFQVSRS